MVAHERVQAHPHRALAHRRYLTIAVRDGSFAVGIIDPSGVESPVTVPLSSFPSAADFSSDGERIAIAAGSDVIVATIETGQIAVNDYLVARQEILSGRREHLERQLQLAKAAAAARFVAGVAP